MKSKLIGNGSFGYIFFPCLKFTENLNINEEEYITKLLFNQDAEDELNYVKLINNVDISCNYHLGEYHKTTLIKDIYNDIIKDYNLSLFKRFPLNELTTIIMKNGGNNLNNHVTIFK